MLTKLRTALDTDWLQALPLLRKVLHYRITNDKHPCTQTLFHFVSTA